METEALISFRAARGAERLLARALEAARAIPKTRTPAGASRFVAPAGRKPVDPRRREASLRVKTGLSLMGLLIELKRIEARLDPSTRSARPGRARLQAGILSYGRFRAPGHLLK